MNEIKKHISCFLLGVIITSCIFAGSIYTSFNRNTEYQNLYRELENNYNTVRTILADRETIISQLSTDINRLTITNRELENSIIERERIISSARNDIQGISEGIDKIEYIIKVLQEAEYDSSSNHHN